MKIKIGIGNVEGKRVNRVENVNVKMWLVNGCEYPTDEGDNQLQLVSFQKTTSEEAKTENLLGTDCD